MSGNDGNNSQNKGEDQNVDPDMPGLEEGPPQAQQQAPQQPQRPQQAVEDARIATHQYIDMQLMFINAISIESQRDYRIVTGFRFKKWMYAQRKLIKPTAQFCVFVSYKLIDYDPTDKGDWVKVNAIVFPELILGENMESEILDQQIYGCFLYMKPISIEEGNKSIEGHLRFTVNMNRAGERGTRRGLFSAVYPHHRVVRYNQYVTSIVFKRETKKEDFYQSRFRKSEIAKEVTTGTVEASLDDLHYFGFKTKQYYVARAPARGQQHLSAIYVPNYVSLVVFFSNREADVEERIKRTLLPTSYKPGHQFHERFLVQCGGLVILRDYPLFFHFMHEKNGETVEFKDIVKKVTHRGFTALSNLIGGVLYPLMVLDMPKHSDNLIGQMQPHFAGYFLEVQNYENPPKAILRFPTGGNISGVYEMRSKKNQHKTDAWTFMNQQWNTENAHNEYTGRKVQENDGSIREAFFNSKQEYRAP